MQFGVAVQVFPVAYHVNKVVSTPGSMLFASHVAACENLQAAYDRMVLALACQLRECSVSALGQACNGQLPCWWNIPSPAASRPSPCGQAGGERSTSLLEMG